MGVALSSAAQVAYDAELEITKTRLLTVAQYEVIKPILPVEYHEMVDFWISQVQTGHQYEYEASLWADRGTLRATNVSLTFPGGQTRVGTLDDDGDLEFADWTIRYYSFADLKEAIPPGTYSIVADFVDGKGMNYTVHLDDYSEASFPEFVPGVMTWTAGANPPLVLQWNTIPQVDEYEISAWEFPDGDDLYDSGNILPAYPSSVTTTLSGTVVSTNLYGVYIQAERDANTGPFRHEFSSGTEYLFLPAKLMNGHRAAAASFQCDLVGGPGTSYLIQGSTNLLDWTSLGVGTVLSSGYYHFADESAVNLARRFYRAIWSPAP